ncbi:hypothetical protein HQ531_08375 [bacterium]|nr:hypothetical protein [bacterium]
MTALAKRISLLLLAVLSLSAHEHWLFTDSSTYTITDSITVHLRSGHTAEESEFLLATNLIQEALVILPDGQQQTLNFQANGKEHTSSFAVRKAGAYTIIVNLRKRNKGPFSHLLKTQIQVGSGNKVPEVATAQGLEIVFNKTPHSLQVLAEGEAVKVPIMLISQGYAGRSLSMDRHGLSIFTPDEPGFQVAVCHFRRQTASFSFYTGD